MTLNVYVQTCLKHEAHRSYFYKLSSKAADVI